MIKIVLIGDTYDGKTSLNIRITKGTFEENNFATIGIDFRIKMLTIENNI